MPHWFAVCGIKRHEVPTPSSQATCHHTAREQAISSGSDPPEPDGKVLPHDLASLVIDGFDGGPKTPSATTSSTT